MAPALKGWGCFIAGTGPSGRHGNGATCEGTIVTDSSIAYDSQEDGIRSRGCLADFGEDGKRVCAEKVECERPSLTRFVLVTRGRAG